MPSSSSSNHGHTGYPGFWPSRTAATADWPTSVARPRALRLHKAQRQQRQQQQQQRARRKSRTSRSSRSSRRCSRRPSRSCRRSAQPTSSRLAPGSSGLRSRLYTLRSARRLSIPARRRLLRHLRSSSEGTRGETHRRATRRPASGCAQQTSRSSLPRRASLPQERSMDRAQRPRLRRHRSRTPTRPPSPLNIPPPPRRTPARPRPHSQCPSRQ